MALHQPTSSTSFTVGLPPELNDKIIDCLRGDVETLSACSLTCRCWQPRAQFHIFRTVILCPETYRPFARLLQSSPHLGHNVRALIFMHHGMYKSEEDESIAESMEVLSFIIQNAPLVRRLDYRLADLKHWLGPLLVELRAVEEVRMDQCSIPNLTALADMLCGFPRLKKLRIGDLYLPMNHRTADEDIVVVSPQRPLVSHPEIEVLRLSSGLVGGDIICAHFTKFLFADSMLSRLHTLEMNIRRHEDGLFWGHLLQTLGSVLQHLYFSLEPHDDSTDLTHIPLSLAPCTGLRTLSFWSLKLRPEVSVSTLVWVPLLLDQLRAPQLEQINFRIRAGGAEPPDMENLDWARIGDILCGQRFVNLKKVTFEIFRGAELRNKIIPFIKGRMPGLEARGITRYFHRYHET
ncbi:hypothetical protein WOLCODRAFT_138589 [Wolfiporia cocos MD-104 SS10]|uniref:F-box domain-containing protein n=1 Tax=Wolfiporia cocos (strain MD-104) TaxID=742152 RepID=A0A2H3K5U0_WOLCO|nr:hypothetical protein WOLCODRAFT_138589 [Wolfiporia cocos MD-104 SS10]